MSAEDFDKLGIDNFVVFRSNEPRDYKEDSKGSTYVAGHTYYIVARVIKNKAKYCHMISSLGECEHFCSVNSYEFRWWKSTLSNRCQIVYKGKDFVDAWNFVQSRSDAEKFIQGV